VNNGRENKTCNRFLIFFLLAFGSNLTQANALLPGDILISEVMANPSAVGDTTGEWFELFNNSSANIDLNGLLLLDDGSDSTTINNGAPLIIAPGDYFVLGRNGDSSLNGGYTADYVYSGFTLGNTADEIVISDGLTELARLNYLSGSNIGAGGISAELSNIAALPPGPSDYFLTIDLTYGLGDFGTPGGPGNMPLSGPSPVPLPSAVWLLGSGLVFLLGVGKRRQQHA